MKDMLRLSLAASLTLLLAFAGIAMAAESIRVVSDIENETAVFSVGKTVSADAAISLDLPAVGISTVTLDGTEYDEIQLPAAEHLFAGETAEDGQPNMPILTTNLAIPDRAGIEYTVEYSGFDVIDNIDIAPSQPATLESGENLPAFTIDTRTYSSDKFYPGDLAEVHDPVIMRDLRMVQVSMYPVQYNPVTRQLRVYRDLSVSVSYTSENAVNPKTVHHQYLSDGFYPIYRSTVSNFDEFFSTTEVRRGGYLIIAKDAFIDTLRALADWKHRKGYTVYITPTTEIVPGGSPSQSQVYNYIRTAYQTWETPPEYVMIVGDESGSYSIPDYPYGSYASDHPYSMVEGSDYLPDLFVSRFSVASMAQLRVALAKVMDYETNPYMDDLNYWRRGLSVAGNVIATTPRTTVLWVRQLLLQNGFTHVDTSFRWSSGETDPYLLGYFNSGPCLISYRGWAGSSGWYSPSFNTGNLAQIQNHNKIGVMASLVCGTGDFASSECFGEMWLRMGSSTTIYKGGPAFYGVTDHSTHTRWNNPIMTGYYWGIFSEEIYHFAAAAVRGKIQQYNTFPRYAGPGGYVEQYFHTYNMLGDPELEIRTAVPSRLSATYPSSLNLGINHIEINVTHELDQPVEGAFVTLVKHSGDEEEVFAVGKTDAAGNIALSFDATTTGEMFVTVSGRNFIPHQGSVSIVDGEIAVGYDSHSIDDDNSGYSSGNGDGIADPGETIELTVDLKNFGTSGTAYNVTTSLESMDSDLISVFDSDRSYGDIAPGQIVSSEFPFVIKIDNRAQEGDIARLKLSVTDTNGDSWYSVIEISIESAKFKVTTVGFPGGNGRLDPGETIEMVLTIQNIGSIDAAGVSGYVTTDDDYTTVTAGSSSFGDIPVDGSANNMNYPFVVTCDASTFEGRQVGLLLHTTLSNGAESVVPFFTTIGSLQANDPTGPDAYGYYMFDNTDTDYSPAPTYEWVECVPGLGGSGTRISFSNSDDYSVIISFPFDFVYYGDVTRDVIVSTNGFIALDTAVYDMGGNRWYNFFNWPIPDPANGRGQISPFWDDLSYTGSTYGVYYWYDEDNHRFIIEWYHMTQRNTSATETFEMIITDPAYYPTLTGDSEIQYLYNAIINNDSGENYSSVGFESFDEKRGLEYTYDNTYTPGAATLANGRAVKITTNTGRGAVGGMVDLSNFGFNQNVVVSSSTGQHRLTPQSGAYWIKNVPPGEVSISAEINGYFPMTIDGVTVTADLTTDNIDFDMTRCPVITDLQASQGLGDRIELGWTAVDHADLAGYNIFRSLWENGDYVKLNTDPVTGTSYTDSEIPDNDIYWYYVTAVFSGDFGAAESFASNKAAGSTGIMTDIDNGSVSIPDKFFLSQNYPNPFNPTTTISYGLPTGSDVKIEIYNVLGQNVRNLMDEYQTAGYKSIVWDGEDFTGSKVSSGIYFYTIKAGDYQASRKMLMIK